ncbi:MAG: hypothetical protein ACOC2M_05225 [bacterium]
MKSIKIGIIIMLSAVLCAAQSQINIMTCKLYFLTFVFLFSIPPLLAQKKLNNLTVGVSFAHFQNVEEMQLINDFPGFYQNSFDPGLEVLYNRTLWEKLDIGTGLSYQWGRNASYIHALRRFRFSEISIPFILSMKFNFFKESGILLSTGIYGGKIAHIITENPTSGGEWIGDEGITHSTKGYSHDDGFLDFYLAMGYHHTVFAKDVVSVTPFLRHRLNTTWLNYHQQKMHYGIKLNYSLKF